MIEVVKRQLALLATVFRKINDRVGSYGAQYQAFAVFGIINYTIPFFMWSREVSGESGTVYVRATASVLCFFLLMKHVWPRWLKPFLGTYWLLTLTFSLPFATTYLMIKAGASTQWLMNQVLSMSILILLVDWLMFLGLLTFGVAAAVIAYKMIVGPIELNLDSDNLRLAGYMYLFTIIIGFVFSRNRENLERERAGAMKAVAGSIAHELRTPLMSIISGAVSMEQGVRKLLTTYEKAETAGVLEGEMSMKQRDMLEEMPGRIERTGDNALLVIDLLLTNLKSVGDANRRERCKAAEIVESAVGGYPFRKHEREKVHVEVKEDFLFEGNRLLLIHVIYNLMKNALYCVKEARKGEIYITTKRGVDFNEIRVRDTALGISAERLPYIFDRFYSGSNHGSGLGLAFTKQVMERLRGRVRCESVEGEYTDFVLMFPRKRRFKAEE